MVCGSMSRRGLGPQRITGSSLPQHLHGLLFLSAGVFDVQDMQLLLRWLDMLARNPKGTDDVKAVTGVLPPVQKLVLQLLGQLNLVGGMVQCVAVCDWRLEMLRVCAVIHEYLRDRTGHQAACKSVWTDDRRQLWHDTAGSAARGVARHAADPGRLPLPI